ncbi:DMT family transporter [Zavarzinia sp.]|uniref:DMT family transporter n=1 Tax=Zavarzinia sp. TaxID=2027920 RepID=UPI00356322F5
MTVAADVNQAERQGLGADWAAIALFCLLWSSAFAPAKIALADCPPLLMLALRFLVAGPLCLAIARVRGESLRLGLPALAVLTLLGLLNNALYLGLSWSGMRSVSSGFAAVLISANPLLVALAAGPLLGERMTGRRLFGLLLGIGGVALVLRSRIGGAGEDPAGTLLVLGGLVALVAGTLAYKRLAPRAGAGPWAGNGVQLLAAGIALLPLSLAVEDVGALRPTANFLLSIGWMIFGVSVGGYFLWFRLLARHSATAASSLHFLMPPLGLGFGFLIAGEAVPLADLAGVVPIALGIALVTLPARRA